MCKNRSEIKLKVTQGFKKTKQCCHLLVMVCFYTYSLEQLALQGLVGADLLQAPGGSHVGPLSEAAAGGVQQDPVKALRRVRGPCSRPQVL